MSEENVAEGSALDAAVGTDAPVEVEDPREELERVVAAAHVKVEKQRAHLAGAEEALASAVAALEGGN